MQATQSSVPVRAGRPAPGADQVARLCGSALTGDAPAEARLFGLIKPALKRMLERIVWDKDSVEDLLQDTMELALIKLRGGAVRRPAQFYSFCCGIGRNLLIKHLRHKQVLAGMVSIDGFVESVLPAGDSWDPVDRMLQEESTAALLGTINRLPRERDRRVLIGHYFLDGTARELAAELRLKEAHFYRVLYRARKRLARLLDAQPQTK